MSALKIMNQTFHVATKAAVDTAKEGTFFSRTIRVLSETAKTVARHATDLATRVASLVCDFAKRVFAQFQTQAQKSVDFAKANPKLAIGIGAGVVGLAIALGAGLGIGCALGKNSKEEIAPAATAA